MFYIMIGIILLMVCFLIKDKNDKIYTYGKICFFILAVMFISLDLYFMYQGEAISTYYHGGEGITYRDLRFHENETSYYVNIKMYDWYDTSVGNYIAWNKTNFELMKLLAPILHGILLMMLLFSGYYFLKKFKLVGGV